VATGTNPGHRSSVIDSVTKGPKFRPQNTKGAERNCLGLEKSGVEYLPDLSKKGRKGAKLFLKFKTARFLTET
jgi:hypothetical protein